MNIHYKKKEVCNMPNYHLFPAEYNLMKIIWGSEPINSTELSRECEDKLGWKKSTTYTMIRKLVKKGLIKNEKAIVSALVNEIDVQKDESEQVIRDSFDNSLPTFIRTFLDGKKITEKDAIEIKKIIEEATK